MKQPRTKNKSSRKASPKVDSSDSTQLMSNDQLYAELSAMLATPDQEMEVAQNLRSADEEAAMLEEEPMEGLDDSMAAEAPAEAPMDDEYPAPMEADALMDAIGGAEIGDAIGAGGPRMDTVADLHEPQVQVDHETDPITEEVIPGVNKTQWKFLVRSADEQGLNANVVPVLLRSARHFAKTMNSRSEKAYYSSLLSHTPAYLKVVDKITRLHNNDVNVARRLL